MASLPPAIEIRLLDHDQVRDLIARLWSTCRSLAQAIDDRQIEIDCRCQFCQRYLSPRSEETGRMVGHRPDCIALLAFNVLNSPANFLRQDNPLDALLPNS